MCSFCSLLRRMTQLLFYEFQIALGYRHFLYYLFWIFSVGLLFGDWPIRTGPTTASYSVVLAGK